nr:MAG TPA: hypothetical protein [Caudoviricetes sp.]
MKAELDTNTLYSKRTPQDYGLPRYMKPLTKVVVLILSTAIFIEMEYS